MSKAKKIIVVSTEFGTEQDEIVVPSERLRELGHTVVIATPSGDDVQTVVGDKDKATVVHADLALKDAQGPFDVVVLPGGTVNSDTGRMDENIQSLVAQQAQEGRVVAAICHAPWILIDSGVADGKTMTSYPSVRTDLRNAGATVVDQSVKVCPANEWSLITSRNPGDLDDFVAAIDQA